MTLTTGATAQEHLQQANTHLAALREALAQALLRQEQVIEQVLWALLAGGHVLLEGAPGLGKTRLVKAVARCLDLQFSRIQFTPDLMPADISGSEVLVLDEHGNSTGRFALHAGPVFAQILLADEINRASPKTQSALLEAMQEAAVTIAGKRHALGPPFMVFATQNPIEMEGTYALPEAQLDRFFVKILVPLPGVAEFQEILERTNEQAEPKLKPLLDAQNLAQLQELCRNVVVPHAAFNYAARLCAATQPGHRHAPELVRRVVRFGASVRAGQALIRAGQARALCQGRAHLAFEDLAQVATPVLRHRVVLSFEGQADAIAPDDVISSVLNATPQLPQDVRDVL